LVWLILFVCASGYRGATSPFGELGPAKVPLLRLLKARGPAMQDFVVGDPGPCGLPRPFGGWNIMAKKLLHRCIGAHALVH
jgi:hypothetical protein